MSNPLNAATLYKTPPEPTVEELKSALAEAKREIKELGELVEKLQPRCSYSPINLDKEEKLVAEETAWIVQKNKKRKFLNHQEIKLTSKK